MSDDLMERLRIFAKFDPDLAAAVSEIERLRAREERLVGALNRIEYLADEMMLGRSSYVGAIRDTARAALTEEIH